MKFIYKRIVQIFLIIFLQINLSVSKESELRNLEDPTLLPEYANFFFINNIKCDSSNCPAPNLCQTSSTCQCGKGYAQFNDPKNPNINPNIYCQYQQKNQLTAFLLQLLLFTGIGQFYVGNLQYAIPQLCVSMVPCILTCISLIFGISIKKNPDQAKPLFHLILLCLSCVFGCATMAWWLADAIIFGMNKYLDGNGVPLNSW